MVDAEDLPGALKARSLLKMLASRPGPGRVVGQIKVYVEALYPEIREARIQGWSWAAIKKELSSVPELPKLSDKTLSQYFLDTDREWAKKTGVAPLVVRKPMPQRRNRNAVENEDQPRKRRGRPPMNRSAEEAA